MKSPRFSNQSECEDYIRQANKLLEEARSFIYDAIGSWETYQGNKLIEKINSLLSESK